MQWQSMKTAPMDGTLVWVTVDRFGTRYTMEAYYIEGAQIWACDDGRYVSSPRVLAWAPFVTPTPYTGTLEELDADGGDA